VGKKKVDGSAVLSVHAKTHLRIVRQWERFGRIRLGWRSNCRTGRCRRLCHLAARPHLERCRATVVLVQHSSTFAP